MSRNGSGVYSPPAASFPAVASTLIESAKYNDVINDLATALTGSLAADGQTTVTANLPMSTYHHTNVGNATALTNYASADQVVDNALLYAASTAGSDTYAITLAISPGTYGAGQRFQFKADVDNTGACTLNINSLGAKSILLADGSTPHNGAIQASSIADVVYDGTQFLLLNPSYADTFTSTTINATTINQGGNNVLDDSDIGANVQAYDADLTALGGLAKTDSNFIVGNGSTWVAESGATARASMGVSIGSQVQGWDANLDQIAALTPTDNYFIVGNGVVWTAETPAQALDSIGVDGTSGVIVPGDLSAATGVWVELGTDTFSSGTTSTLTSIMDSTYNTYMIVWYDVDYNSASSGAGYVGLRFGISGSIQTGNIYAYNLRIGNFGSASTETTSSATSYIPVSGVHTYNQTRSAFQGVAGHLILHNPSNTTYYKKFSLSSQSNSYDENSSRDGGGQILTASALDSVQLHCAGAGTTTFTSGTFRCYGLKT